AELRDRVLALASALRRLLRLTLRRLLLGLALRGLLLGSLLVALPPRLDRVDQAARGTGPHAEHGQTCAAAVLPGRLHAARDGLVDEGLRAVARQRVGLLHVGQQLAGALVVLDRDDRGLHDRQTAVGGPAVALLDGGRQRLREAHRVTLDGGDAIALVGIVRVAREGLGERAHDLLEQLTADGVVDVAE